MVAVQWAFRCAGDVELGDLLGHAGTKAADIAPQKPISRKSVAFAEPYQGAYGHLAFAVQVIRKRIGADADCLGDLIVFLTDQKDREPEALRKSVGDLSVCRGIHTYHGKECPAVFTRRIVVLTRITKCDFCFRMMTHADLIDALGGPTTVGRLTGQKQNTVSNWKGRGVPWRWRAKLAAEARKNGVDVPEDFATPSPEPEPAQ